MLLNAFPLDSVEQAYHPENCYHNSTHAADVTQALYCLLSETKVKEIHSAWPFSTVPQWNLVFLLCITCV